MPAALRELRFQVSVPGRLNIWFTSCLHFEWPYFVTNQPQSIWKHLSNIFTRCIQNGGNGNRKMPTSLLRHPFNSENREGGVVLVATNQYKRTQTEKDHLEEKPQTQGITLQVT